MKRIRLLPNLQPWISFMVVLTITASLPVYAQQCSPDALAAKYWQYKQQFNKHFIVIDRDPSGCVHDGIGQQGENSCEFAKAGFSLPATSINMSPDGGSGLINKGRHEVNGDGTPNTVWADIDCAGVNGISWDHSTHNYLDMGSETPHQMGWYWVVLATEYELLKRNGQHDAAQRTLEELFLGLQAYRRLDMQAQCMALLRYSEITAGFETEMECNSKACLCGEKYREGGHKHFDSPCDPGCTYTPQLDGYSGFFLREDATQALENVLHDDSEDKYNIDMIASDYAMSLSPPCATTFSQPCYLVRRQNFMSQDGMTGLLLGLAMIKKYIPVNAEVTTCDGEVFRPHDMAVKIASAMVDNVDDRYNNRISWPMSKACCDKEVFLSESEGGRLMATIHGFKKAASFIDGKKRRSNIDEFLAWQGLFTQTATSFSNNAKFWLRLKALGWDMGDAKNNVKTLFQSSVETQNLEILVLMNNLLYPGGENLSADQSFFLELLCNAPCEGSCRKQDGYANNDPNWPQFNCSNTPRWQGQGWETGGDNGISRLFNGLDFMALYNIYMLHYPGSAPTYYNPEHPPADGDFGSNRITGPNVLCQDQTAYYEAQPLYTRPNTTVPNPLSITEILWTGSSNFSIPVNNTNGTDITALHSATPSFIEARFTEDRQILSYYNTGDLITYPMPGPNGIEFVPTPFFDYCTTNYRKPVFVDEQEYTIETELDHCRHDYWFHAVGPETENTTYVWKLEFYHAGGSNVSFFSGKDIHIQWPLPGALGGTSAMVVMTLTINSPCGQQVVVDVDSYNSIECPWLGYNLNISPNPGRDQVSVYVTEGYEFSSGGLDISFINTGTGAVQATRQIYSNGESVDVSTLPEGLYYVRTILDAGAPVNTSFVISRQ